VDEMVRKYICFGQSAVLDDDKYVTLKEVVAKRFDVHPTAVLMVGSAKLGFSIKPKRRFLPFGDSSDIDVAIVSDALFERVWHEVHACQKDLGWWDEAVEFRKYLFHGWIRPDKLPSGEAFQFSRQWWDYFARLTQCGDYGPYKIGAGIYHSMYFLEQYQGICMSQCREPLADEERPA